MSARNLSAPRIRKQVIKMEASELRSTAHVNKVAKRKEKRREWGEMDEDIRSRWASNLVRYWSLLFDQKIEFALRGYVYQIKRIIQPSILERHLSRCQMAPIDVRGLGNVLRVFQ